MKKFSPFPAFLAICLLFGNSAFASECERILSEVARTEKRLLSSEFTTGRRLLTELENSTKTTYEHLLGPGFRNRILVSDRVLELGAGNGQAGSDLRKLHGEPYFDLDAAVFEIPVEESILAANFDRIFVGDVLKGSVEQADYSDIIDAYGPFAYVKNVDLLLGIVATRLRIGGQYRTVFDKQVVRWKNEREQVTKGGAVEVLPNFIVVDDSGRDITGQWLASIQGLKLISDLDDLSSYRNFISGLSRESRKVEVDGLVYVKTDIEEINPFVPLIFERVPGPIRIPSLNLVEYIDGRPPIRIYQLAE